MVYFSKLGLCSPFCHLFCPPNSIPQMSIHVMECLPNRDFQGRPRILFECIMIYSTNPLLSGIQVVSVICWVWKGSSACPGLCPRLKPDPPPLDPAWVSEKCQAGAETEALGSSQCLPSQVFSSWFEVSRHKTHPDPSVGENHLPKGENVLFGWQGGVTPKYGKFLFKQSYQSSPNTVTLPPSK